ncbi:Maf family protein [Aestuariirhabdus litorea]|uniref:dTTP/UTP pyrophosphatase n=1 Tax=Aestuariirhabdus litorea TaxID=2528527 RepID=A0A3P3VQ48_9GAMM|nr:Maf family protein [Aestuariirhabdus litorea]RRJ83709.1 septum formation inhibitor Maf [Aestuariirhabdus litorea]RWW96931.1 septum formation inhibitor Maf [Endozoicomonadaceae bacterium GTF-13]
MTSASLYLASNSPRRRELLRQIGVSFESLSVEIDETPLAGEVPEDYVVRMAQEKVRAALSERPHASPLPVLCADTTVVLGDRILGKPACREEAVSMLLALSGREHRVLTAVAISDGGSVQTRLIATRVWFGAVTESLAQRYWDSGEAADKAGSYGIQGKGALFVQRIEGSYSAVVGLPLAETAELLAQFGVPYWVY